MLWKQAMWHVLEEFGYKSNSSHTLWADKHNENRSLECDDSEIYVIFPEPSQKRKRSVI